MNTLTESQKKAVNLLGQNIIVSAGAGTGKTRVLVDRIIALVRSGKAQITEILALTFTEKAANEIKIRLSARFRELGMDSARRDLESSVISTFHSFASRLLREHPIEACVDPEFRVIKEDESDFLKEDALTEAIEESYSEADKSFLLLNQYGENPIREGLLKILTAARHEGKSLVDFFSDNSKKRELVCVDAKKRISEKSVKLAQKLKDSLDIKGFKNFLDIEDWDWEKLKEFREWYGPYRKGGKKDLKNEWREWRNLVGELIALKIEKLGLSWCERFEKLALGFEKKYEAKKQEKNFLDFDDLQIKAVKLFSSKKLHLQKLCEKYKKKFKFILIDEFQDTNFLQLQFAGMVSGKNNLFMVGDYRQSIYGFRGAEPKLFLEREKMYREGVEGVRIPLLENFRSHKSIIDFVNCFFELLWEDEEKVFEKLLSKRKEKEGRSEEKRAVEVYKICAKEKEPKEMSRMREADLLARRIQELHFRGVKYGEIAVLFQAMTSSGIYEHAFKVAGIPYFITSGRGFYQKEEIRDIISFLSYLENPLADITLAASLKSPLVGISDDTLFWLAKNAKKKDEKEPLSRALNEVSNISEIKKSEKEKLNTFILLTKKLREEKDRIDLSDLIDLILKETGYELSVLTSDMGVRKYANLKKLIVLAREYEAYEKISLHTFLKILRRLETKEIRESEAQIETEKSTNAVRMMSIHSAKGLEFPVTIIADMGRRKNHSESGLVVASSQLGYGMRLKENMLSKEEEPYFYNLIKKEISSREQEERKRLFYVASTRAMDMLILSGVHSDTNTKKNVFSGSWINWISDLESEIPVKIFTDFEKTSKNVHREKPLCEEKKFKELLKTLRPRELNLTKDDKTKWAEAEKRGADIISSSERKIKSFSRSIDLPVSAYILFMKDRELFWRTYQIGWNESVKYDTSSTRTWTSSSCRSRPCSLGTRAEEILVMGSGPSRDFGNSVHHVLQHINFKRPEKFLQLSFLSKMLGISGKGDAEQILDILIKFSESSLFRKIQKAPLIKRETSFVLNERHGLIYGVIDLLFKDSDGNWHLIDYKVSEGSLLKAKEQAYDLQMEVYALAVKELLNISIKSGIVYFLKNGAEVRFEFDFKKIKKRVSDLQIEILNFSNYKKDCQKNEKTYSF